MKYIERWHWTYTVGKRTRKTLIHYTEAEILREHPEGKPVRIEGSVQIERVVEHAEELDMSYVNAMYGPSKSAK